MLYISATSIQPESSPFLYVSPGSVPETGCNSIVHLACSQEHRMELHVGEMSAHVKMTTDVLCCPSSRDCMASVPCALLNHKKVFFSFLSAFSIKDWQVGLEKTDLWSFQLATHSSKRLCRRQNNKKRPCFKILTFVGILAFLFPKPCTDLAGR